MKRKYSDDESFDDTKNEKSLLELLPREILQEQLLFLPADDVFTICQDTVLAEESPDIKLFLRNNIPIYLSICKDPKFHQKLYPRLEYISNKIRVAARSGHLEMVKILVSQGATYGDLDNAAFEASKAGHLDILKYATEKGAAIYGHKVGSLNHSIRNGHIEIVKWLLNNGAHKSDIPKSALQKVKDKKMMAYLENLGIKL